MADKRAHELHESHIAVLSALSHVRDQKMLSVEGVGIEFLDPPVRAYNCLKRAGIDTMLQLLDYMGDDREQGELNLMKIRNLGRKSVEEITVKLDRFFATYGGTYE